MPVVALPDRGTPVKLQLDLDGKLTHEQYLDFCAANPDLHVERTAEGEIIVMPPAGGESSFRSGESFGELRAWAKEDGRGVAFDSSVQFLLPDGSALSPDASWVSNESLRKLSKSAKKLFLPLTPEFIIESMSPSDRLKHAKAKMEGWIANGVQLAWLIDGDRETVHIYRHGRSPEIRKGIKDIAAERPVAGFILQLTAIWRGI